MKWILRGPIDACNGRRATIWKNRADWSKCVSSAVERMGCPNARAAQKPDSRLVEPFHGDIRAMGSYSRARMAKRFDEDSAEARIQQR